MNDTINSSALNTYLKKLKKACPRKAGDKLVSDLNDSLYNYLDCNPDATYENFEQRFGVPENIASDFLKSMDNEELTKLTNKSGWIKKAIITLTITAVIIMIIAGIWLIHEVIDQPDIYYYETSIEDGTTGTLE